MLQRKSVRGRCFPDRKNAEYCLANHFMLRTLSFSIEKEQFRHDSIPYHACVGSQRNGLVIFSFCAAPDFMDRTYNAHFRLNWKLASFKESRKVSAVFFSSSSESCLNDLRRMIWKSSMEFTECQLILYMVAVTSTTQAIDLMNSCSLHLQSNKCQRTQPGYLFVYFQVRRRRGF